MAKKTIPNNVIFDSLCDSILTVINTFCVNLKKANAKEKKSERNKSKKKAVSDFQDLLLIELNKRTPGISWVKEFIKPGSAANDRVDIYCKVKPYNWVIEIDTSRADQVAKKAFSRFALHGIKNPIFYVAIIYPGTSSMNLNEVIKYSRYGYDISTNLNNNSDFRTIIIDCEKPCLRIVQFTKNMKFTVDGIGDYSMVEAIEFATQEYLKREGKSFITLERELNAFEGLKNRNGQELIVSATDSGKTKIRMKDNNGITFYLSKQWMFFGKKANFDAIARFFKNRNISIEPKLEVRTLH